MGAIPVVGVIGAASGGYIGWAGAYLSECGVKNSARSMVAGIATGGWIGMEIGNMFDERKKPI